jgi:hypothetical protein
VAYSSWGRCAFVRTPVNGSPACRGSEPELTGGDRRRLRAR